MKVMLEFSLPDDKDELKCVQNGVAYREILWGLSQWIRDRIKYADRNDLVEVRDKLFALLNEYNVDID